MAHKVLSVVALVQTVSCSVPHLMAQRDQKTAGLEPLSHRTGLS